MQNLTRDDLAHMLPSEVAEYESARLSHERRLRRQRERREEERMIRLHTPAARRRLDSIWGD